MTISKPKTMDEALKLIELLQSKNNSLQAENNNLKQRNDSLELLVHNMNEMLTKGRKMMFGRSSEQLRYVEGYEPVSYTHLAHKITPTLGFSFFFFISLSSASR